MKRLLWLAVLGLFLAGCGKAAQESQFWEHETMYANWDHLGFSWYGYKNPTKETAKESVAQKWWGNQIPGPSEQ